MSPFVAQKTKQQVKSFNMEELKKIYRGLMTIDFEAKIGKTDAKTALELFMVSL
jgi:DNA polymerase III delta subunit